MPRAGPAERFQHIGHGLRPRQAQARAVTLVRQAGKLPCPLRIAERDHGVGRPAAIGIERDFLRLDRLPADGEQRIDDLLGGEPAALGGVEESLLRGRRQIRPRRLPLVELRRHDRPLKFSQIVAAGDEVIGEPRQQIGVAGGMAFPVVRRLDNAGTDKLPPDAVGNDLREPAVLRRGDQRRQPLARVGRLQHHRVERLVVGAAGGGGEWPDGLDRLAGLERDFDQRLAGLLLEERRRHRAALGHRHGLALEHRRQRVQILLLGAVVGGVVAAGTLQFNTQERLPDDMTLGGERRVVVGGKTEARCTAFALATSEQNQLCHHAVQRRVVAQRFVQARLEHVRVFRQHVLPVAHPMVAVARIGEQTVDRRRALVG